jgi:high-affinity Fe2+/Pb2+ permease
MLKGILRFVSLVTGLAAAMTLLLIFVVVWICGSAGVEEDNIIIRSLETAMLVFAVAGLGTLAYKELHSLVELSERRKKNKDSSDYNPPGGKK